jgi:phage-related protein
MSTFYDRSNNIDIASGDRLTGLYYTPVYGSRVSFSSKANVYETDDSYYNLIPLSINSLDAKFELRFDLDESGSQKLVDFIENKSGYIMYGFTDASAFYKTISGVTDNYAVNHINKNHYEVALSIEVNEAPTLLNWSGMTFVNSGLQHWSAGTSYKKYDIVYSGISSNKLNNYYYCTQDHSSSSSSIDGPTGSTSKWTQSFFFEPDIGLQNDVQIKIGKIEFKNSFTQRIKTIKKHLAPINLSYKFTNISTREAKSIMHFLENKAGYRRFLHQIPSVYNRPKVFYAPSWNHSWNYLDSHNIEVNLIEDPLGIIPTGT